MSEFTMTVFDPKAIAETVVNEEKPVSEEERQLKEMAENNVKAIIAADDSLESRRKLLTPIEEFGLKSLQSSKSKSDLLSISVGKLAQAGDEGGLVSKGLMDLQKELKDLDPSVVDFTKKGLFGRFFNPIRGYFAKYQKAESVIANILSSLESGKETLKRDNVTLDIEQASLRDLSKKLRREIELGGMMGEAIQLHLDKAAADNQDPDKIRFIKEEIQYPLTQRVMDLNQMLVVNHQGIISMEVITRNNKELIRGVDRAMNVTVSALRTSVMVASALYNQKIVLTKIQALNQTTADIIAATSTMLKEQGTAIQKQAMESTVSVDVLKKAFEDVLWSLDEIGRYKTEAIPKMQATINEFRVLANEGEKAIQRMEQGKLAAARAQTLIEAPPKEAPPTN
ncbi:MAG: toxic anion resistance protein [Deltaproteobacteria bacterium]|jgi:uncharacterized protein YaaN involved in tellurite resistance|nr:toxic anion resistance protein [Deltaproteobacteria bacterium]